MKLHGLGFTEALTLIFVVMKLVGVIDWSWWWVFSPSLIGAAIALLVILVVVALGGGPSRLPSLGRRR